MDQNLESPETGDAYEAGNRQMQHSGKSEDSQREAVTERSTEQKTQSNENGGDNNNTAEVGAGTSGAEMDNFPLKQNELTETQTNGNKNQSKIDSGKPDSENAVSSGNASESEKTKTADLVTPNQNESEKFDQNKTSTDKLEPLSSNFNTLISKPEQMEHESDKYEVQNESAIHGEGESKKQSILAEHAFGHNGKTECVKMIDTDSIRSEPEKKSAVTVAAGNELEKVHADQQVPGKQQEKTGKKNRLEGLNEETEQQVSPNSNLEMEKGEGKKKTEHKTVKSRLPEKQLEQPLSKHQQKKQRTEKRKNKGQRSRTSKQQKHGSYNQGHECTSISSCTSLPHTDIEEDGEESDAKETTDDDSEKESSIAENDQLPHNLEGSHDEVTKNLVYARDPSSNVDKNRKSIDTRGKVTSSDAEGKGSSSTVGHGKDVSSSDKQPGKGKDQGNPSSDGCGKHTPVEKPTCSRGETGCVSSSVSGTNSQKGTDDPTSSKPRASSQKPNAAQTRETTSQLEVHFHIGLSPEFHFEEDKHEIYVIFFPMKDKFKMKIVEPQACCSIVMLTGSKLFSADLTSPVQYKYGFANKENKNPEEIFLEHSTLSNSYNNRCLDIKSLVAKANFKQRDGSSIQGASGKFAFWQQYDGIARPTPSEKIFKRWANLFLNMFKDNDSAWLDCNSRMIQAIIPEGLCARHHPAEEALKDFQHVYNCVASYFLDLTGRRFLKDKVDKMITKHVLIELEKIQEELRVRDICPIKSGARLASALSIIHIARTYSITLDQKYVSVLCKALLLQPDYEKRISEDFDQLLLHFPTMMEKVRESLLDFLNRNACRSTGHWLLAIPLVHFLTGDSKPFQNLSYIKAAHNAQSGEWWGERCIKDATCQSKQPNRSAELCKDIEETVNQLTPLFEVDLLFPRTLLASMTFDDVAALLPNGRFPSDACLANLYFFIKRCVQRDDLIKVGSLIEIIAVQIEKATGSRKIVDAECEWEVCSCLELCSIALDLVKAACEKVHRPNLSYWTVISSLKAFLAAVKKMQHLLDLHGKKYHDQQTNLHSKTAEILSEGQHRIFKWLNDCFRFSMNEIGTQLHVLRYPEELQCLDDLMDVIEKFLKEKQKEDWIENWRRHLQERVKTMHSNVIEYFAERDKDFSECRCPMIEEIFTQCVFETLDDFIKKYGMDSVLHLCSKSGKMFRVLAKLYQDKWPTKPNDDLVVLQHILGWPAFVLFQKSFGKLLSESTEDHVTENYQVLYTSAISLLETTLKQLLEGSITIQTLKVLLEKRHQEQLLAISNNIEGGFHITQPVEGGKQSILIQTVLSWRRKELEEYERQLKLLRFFVGICNDVKSVDLTPLRSHLQCDMNPMRMWEFCEPRNLDTIEDKSSYHPNISCFAFSKETLEILEKLETLSKSALFTNMWKVYTSRNFLTDESSDASDDDSSNYAGRALSETVCFEDYSQDEFQDMYKRTGVEVEAAIGESYEEQLEEEEEENVDGQDAVDEDSVCNRIVGDVIKFVWRPTMRNWNQLKMSLKSCTISVERIQRLFGRFLKDYSKIESELKVILEDCSIAKQRLEQIELLDQVDATTIGAKVILSAKRKFKIQGDFTDLETLVDLSCNRSVPLSSISRGLLRSADKLKSITEDKSKCLEVFLENKVLADWLKMTLPLKELRTFIDIALIVATGEGAVQVEYIVCLDAAVKGYAPFIYHIKDNLSYEEFLQLCFEVWEVLQADPKLPEKFAQTARNLEFLKQIQESHGSVEGSAISKTKCINRSGVYNVGFHEEKSFKDLANVISLKYNLDQQSPCADQKLPVDDKTRCMDLRQLTDLHNKLMLIVGRDEDIKAEVEQFGEVFTGILRLGKTYIKLCTAGCSLFHHWRAVFFCSPNKKNKVYVDFSSDGPTLKAGGKSVTGQIQDICRYMESCLEEWLKHVEEQREQFYHLNFFTTQQLMILQRELSKISNNSTEDVVGQEVYALLSLVNKDCSYYDLFLSFSTAVQQMMEQDTVNDAVQEDNNEEVPVHQRSEEEDSIRSAFVQVMIESGFSEALALRALDAGIDPSSTGDGTLWCMENQDGEEMLSMCKEASLVREDSVTQKTPSEASDQWIWPEWQTASLTSITSDILRDLACQNDDLMTNLGQLWSSFLGQTAESFTDCLSLKHVGLILKSLAPGDEVEDENRAFERPMPMYLKTSQPNLIVCSKSDVLSVVLSIYSFNEGAKLPLPGIDEVLLCLPDTTAEDVELLFRRATQNNGKIYCLVYADLLDYDVACRVEDRMLRFFPTALTQGLRLVVICCREQEVRSNIVSALDRYRVHVPQLDSSELKTYLKKHFVVKSDGKLGLKYVPASYVDPEQCSVRQIQSYRSGVGKTLRVKRFAQDLQKKQRTQMNEVRVMISLHSKTVDHSKVMKDLLASDNCCHPRIFHLDIAPEVQEGVDHLLFSLLILGSVTDEDGFVWRRKERDLYIVECMPLMMKDCSGVRPVHHLIHQMFSLLPLITCWSPQDSIDILQDRTEGVKLRHPECIIGKYDQLMDAKEFESEELQRPFQYLKQFSSGKQVQKIRRITTQGTPEECIQCLLRHCGVVDPSWSELHNFASFLNTQLKDCEQSCFCADYLSEDLPGFLTFVVKFMIRMSKDFATRSLKISEESPGFAAHRHVLLDVGGPDEEQGEDGVQDDNLLQGYSLKRRWEMSPHPYLFFNNDHNSFTFMGFIMDRHTQNLLDPKTNMIIERQIMPQNLHHALYRNNVNLQEDFENLPRHLKIDKLCNVMGQVFPYDPDETYELTGDNIKKILAIFMRFRCHIPVVIMGETGCGKTRLVKFMCDLWHLPGEEIENMILLKMHGGTTEEDILKCLHHAIVVSKKNMKKNPNVRTVLFFDEANTTEAIGLIKEIMCDQTCNGKPLPDTSGLHLIAACNPYRKHSDVMIDRLEQAGLGYRVRADQTREKLGYIPMRQLVYRVQALPQSMLPLVWDFGQLNDDVESLYIHQMVNRHLKELPELAATPHLERTLSRILAESQAFMRRQQDECSFVSLRDVERALKVMTWFYRKGNVLFKLMDKKANKPLDEIACLLGKVFQPYEAPKRHTRSLILALGVCYHACLKNREEYRHDISKHFRGPCALTEGPETFMNEINLCQDVFLDNVGNLADDIARNKALKENVFMMVVCIELRIPLFLVGKPGSSKSLAKTIVGNAMLGKASVGQLFKEMKSVHMVSFQCSPLSTPEGIIGTFEQCAQLQKDKELDKHVAVVVLDEVGLAEDSPKMPLKTLHPLLEYGCEINGQVEEYSKVGFIGISNWALDPAKMNRGILVLREVPDEEELLDSAKGICSGDRATNTLMTTLMKPLTSAYEELYKEMQSKKREFFGLRDFYSLIKMVYAFCKKSKGEPTWFELKHAILRNFDGFDDPCIRPLKIFENRLPQFDKNAKPGPGDPDCSSSALIQASLRGIGLDSESRYLLILTENYVALSLLQQQLEDLKNAITIFGSSFPRDQEYTQICRNINRIKTCMENGRTVVLLNLENLYESLYDALNQYYMYFNQQRFVDLGLGTQRVKCKVHQQFRLIVVAEKTVVYEKFPIPLINRLEKHILSMETMLSEAQMNLVKKLQKWAEEFCRVDGSFVSSKSQPKLGDVFIGYHADAAASIILQLWKQIIPKEDDKAALKKVFESAKSVLLQCATPDSLIRLSRTRLACDPDKLQNQYFVEQTHSSLADLIRHEISETILTNDSVFVQVTTHSLLLSRGDLSELSLALGINPRDIHLHSLQGFDTEQQFCSLLRDIFRPPPQSTIMSGVTDLESPPNVASRLFLLQCDSGDTNPELIACARYNIFNEYSQVVESQLGSGQSLRIHVMFIIQLPRVPGGCFAGFQGGKWKCYHLDELLPATEYLPKLSTLKKLRISELFCQVVELEGQRGDEDHPPVSFEYDEKEEEATVKKNLEQNESTCGERLNASDRLTQDDCRELHEIKEDLLKFSVDHLILNCLHRAAAFLKDSEKDHNLKKTELDSEDKSSLQSRKIHRLNLLLKLLKESDNEQDGLSLMSAIKKRLGRLLRDKETATQMPEQAGSWLTNEVSTMETTAKAGTFRRALLQTLESKVTPLLSGIIAYADRNANFDLLEKNSPWRQKLWLEMLSEEEVTLFRYRDLHPPEHRTQTGLPEYAVTNTGCDGRFFESSFPFSWVIKDQIDLLLHQMRHSGNPVDVLVSLLKQTDLGRVLTKSVSRETEAEAVNAYITDFAQMVYKCCSTSEVELKWVTDDLKRTMTFCKVTPDDTETSFVVCLVKLHLAYKVVRPRLLLFTELLRIWPESLQFITHGGEMHVALDLKILFLILEHLVTEAKQLDIAQYQRDWLARVDLLSPLIEQLLESSSANPDEPLEQQVFDQCCTMWNRVHCVQLFIKRVCLSNATEACLVAKRCMLLFRLLGEKANFKGKKSFEALESFLKNCNKVATEYYIGLGICAHCGKPISDPVELPCTHTMCLACAVELKQLSICGCPSKNCEQKFPKDLRLTPLKGKSKEVVAHNKYRKCLNSFFMEVIYSLCFLRNSSPSEEVVKRLMEYVTLGAKETFEEKADPSPVVRSFVLQVLLQSKNEKIRSYLDDYFQRAHTVLKSTSEEIAELCVLVVNCLEDYYKSLGSTKSTLPDQIVFLRDILKNTGRFPMRIDETPSAATLESFGKIRFVLNQAAAWIHHTQILKDKDVTMTEIWPLLQELRRYLETSESKWPRVYLMRLICHNYGLEILKQLGATPCLHWIMSPEGKEETEEMKKIPDKFLIYGNSYRSIRDLIFRVTLGDSTEELMHMINDLEKKDKLCGQLMLLAIYRSVTLNYRHLEESQKTSTEVKKTLMEICKLDPFIKTQEDLLEELIEDRLPGSLLVVSPDQTTRQLTLAELLTHFYIVMFTIRKQKLHSPFVSLVFTPAALQNSLFPTMPQDDLERLQSAITQKGGAAIYNCPNGHPYVIGDCGNPDFVRNCPACGEEIGGLKYVPRPGNVRVDRVLDQTRRGHCLGSADLRSEVPMPERDLSPAATAIMRLMLHMSMYLASSAHTKDVCNLISPAISEDMLEKYLSRHIKADLHDIGKALGRNEDDVILLIHLLLHQLTSAKTPKSGPQGLPVLATKEERQEWENIYDRTYIIPVLKILSSPQFNSLQETIRDDGNLLGNSKLIRLLYEIDRPLNCGGDGEKAENISHLWRFRAQISLENLTHQLNDNIPVNQNQNAILKLFLREHWRLRFLRYLPSITKLNQLLKQHLIQQTSKEAATKWTMKSSGFKQSFSGPHLFEEIVGLIKDFEVLWKDVRQNLSSFVFAGGLRLSKEQCCQSVDHDTKIATFVATGRGEGLRSLALVSYLCDVQNQFMEEYSRLTGQSLETVVDIGEASSTQIITLHQQDILPLLLANCTYSLKAGEGTTIRYDFGALERQIEDRFIRGKPRLQPYKVDQLAMLDDVSYAKLFEQLRQRIHQEPLPLQMKAELGELKSKYSELNGLLADLDTALGYLAFTGGKPNEQVHHFMTTVLRMKPKLKSAKVQGICLKHFESLWLNVTFMKARQDCSFKTDPFEAVEDKYKEELTETMAAGLIDSLQGRRDVDILVLSLFECILFQITAKPSDPGMANGCNDELGLILDAYIEQKASKSGDWKIPPEIKVKHCISTWKHLVMFRSTTARR